MELTVIGNCIPYSLKVLTVYIVKSIKRWFLKRGYIKSATMASTKNNVVFHHCWFVYSTHVRTYVVRMYVVCNNYCKC